MRKKQTLKVAAWAVPLVVVMDVTMVDDLVVMMAVVMVGHLVDPLVS